jgi:hypothetical protein
MVWAGIWRDGRTELVIMERDETSPRRGYTAKSYRKALEEALLPIYNGTHQFQQDNARIHVYGGTPEWLQLHGIEFIDWPPHSPDLNPIEHVWRALKAKLIEKHPETRDLQDNKVDRAKLVEWLQEAWRAIDQVLIRKLIDSIPRRILAVIRAKGYYTKY